MPEIKWKLRLSSSPEDVFDLLVTDAGREKFWTETSRSDEGGAELTFPSGITTRLVVKRAERPRVFDTVYFDAPTRFDLERDGDHTILSLTADVPEAEFIEVNAGWVSVLMALKAAADFGADLRNHSAEHSWDQGFVDN